MAITDEHALRAVVPDPPQKAWDKEQDRIDPHTARFLAASPFAVLATAGADGRCDASPRGGPPGFAVLLEPDLLVLPDYAGNRRQDSHRNILANPHVGLVFLVPGVQETLRVNGRARLRDDAELLDRLPTGAGAPKLALEVAIETAFVHCGKAPHRAGLWAPDRWPEPVSLLTARAAVTGEPEESVRRHWQEGFDDPAQLWG
jgi:PPOX class probable FMN-dependent enzyme